MNDGCQAITEVHQKNIQMPTFIIIPSTLDAKAIICMMNKNLPAYLWHTLLDQGFPEDFITNLLNSSCEAATVADCFKCVG